MTQMDGKGIAVTLTFVLIVLGLAGAAEYLLTGKMQAVEYLIELVFG